MQHFDDLSSLTISQSVISMIPAAVAWESCVLPFTMTDETFGVILPVDSDPARLIDIHAFMLNRTITASTADRQLIEAELSRYYPDYVPQEEVPLPEAIPDLDSKADYSFLDLTGRIEFRSDTSLSFRLGRVQDFLERSDGTREWFGKSNVFHVTGWLDLHYPCHGFHKLQIRCSVSDEYPAFETMCELVTQVCQVLELPESVSYNMYFKDSGQGGQMENPQSGFACTTKWIPPPEE